MESSLDLWMKGERSLPEDFSLKDWAEVFLAVQKAIEEEGKRDGLSLESSPIVALLGIERGSSGLKLGIAERAIRGMARITRGLSTGDMSDVSPMTREPLAEIEKFVRRRNLTLELNGHGSIPSAIISEKHPVPPLPKETQIRGTTTILASCIRVGGVKPTAKVVFVTKKGELTIRVSKAQAARLAASLYGEVLLVGIATWDSRTWEVIGFELEKIEDSPQKNGWKAIEELAEKSGETWDSIDPDEFVLEFRGE